MNKKFLVIALMATLSTLGYAFETVGGNVENLNTINHGTWNQTTIDKINSNVNSIVSKTDENFTSVQNQLNNKVNTDNVYTKGQADDKFASKGEINGKVNQSDFDDLKGQVNANKDKIAELDNQLFGEGTTGGVINDINSKLDEKANKGEVESLKNEVGNLTDFRNETATAVGNLQNDMISANGEIESIKGNVEKVKEKVENITEDIADINGELGNKVSQDEYVQDKENIYDSIKGAMDYSDGKDKALEGKITAEETARKEADIALEGKITAEETARKEADIALEGKITAEETARENADKALDKKITANETNIANLQQTSNNHEARITHLEDRVDRLDEKMNEGLSLMAAMNAVDFQNVEAGEMAIGAGFGHYGNAQSVAVGVAYAPTDNFNVNVKYSATAGNPESFAIGAGASYKFKVGR